MNELVNEMQTSRRENILKVVKKIVGVSLLVGPLWQLFVAVDDILFVLPKLNFVEDLVVTRSLQLNMFKKAVIISTGLLFNSAYGLNLLIRHHKNNILSIMLGVILFVLSQIVFKLSAIDKLIFDLQFLPLT